MEGRTAFIGAERRDPLLEYYSWRLASFSLLAYRFYYGYNLCSPYYRVVIVQRAFFPFGQV